MCLSQNKTKNVVFGFSNHLEGGPGSFGFTGSFERFTERLVENLDVILNLTNSSGAKTRFCHVTLLAELKPCLSHTDVK